MYVSERVFVVLCVGKAPKSNFPICAGTCLPPPTSEGGRKEGREVEMLLMHYTCSNTSPPSLPPSLEDSTYFSHFRSLLFDREDADMVFVVGLAKDQVPAHKVILTARYALSLPPSLLSFICLLPFFYFLYPPSIPPSLPLSFLPSLPSAHHFFSTSYAPPLPPSLPPFLDRSDYFRALFRKGGMKESEEGVMVVESYT